ncbi:MAG: electron transport complex subunit RsxE [Gammaproteobacteria bacterium]|nr:electron transport complex subunit RsxE [Gammaproteobacteria bacterium]MCI0590850.1 electron transport complex subunit RsxE [Gammaproteobacteria bacterium]
MSRHPDLVILQDRVWDTNPALVQLLGLCPLLAVSDTFIKGFALGLATLLAVLATSVTVSALRYLVPHEVRVPAIVLLLASFVTIIDLGLKAYFYELSEVLSIFVPLIAVNCMIIARAEEFAACSEVRLSLFDGLATGLGFLLALAALGTLREMLGYGTLLRDAALLFGERAGGLEISLDAHYPGMHLVRLPAGAFFILGLLIALRRALDTRGTAEALKGEHASVNDSMGHAPA